MIKGKLIIFDLDGTLALTEHRQHFLEGEVKDWAGFFNACDEDEPNEPVVALYKMLYDDNDIIVFSGRSDAVHDKTTAWFEKHNIPFPDGLFMRADGDYTPDEQLKREWLTKFTEEELESIAFVVDDRSKVVKMWRDAGLTCFQVAEGNF